MDRTPCRHNTAGILLVEALVSLMVFLVASFSIYGLLAHARTANVKARETVMATALARELLEEQRQVGFEALSPGTRTDVHRVSRSRDGVHFEVEFEREVEVRPGPNPRIWSVSVAVRWTGYEIEMESYVVE